MGWLWWTRCTALFDIYSTRPAARVVVLCTMLLGAALLYRSEASGSTFAALPFLLLLLANWERFLTTLESLLDRHSWLVLAVPLCVFLVRFVVMPPTASDDLLRHIASSYWPRGYADMFVHADVPSGNYYAAFDWLVGRAAHALGRVEAMWLIQALALSGFVAAYLLAARRVLHVQEGVAPLLLISLALVLAIAAERIALGRPEIFMTVWVLAAAAVRGPAGTVGWVAGGVALICGYLLSPLYFPAVILLPVAWRYRAVAFVALLAFWVGFWLWMTEGDLVAAVLRPFELLATRGAGVEVGENRSIINAVVLSPAFMLLVLAAAWAFRAASADRRVLVLALYFVLSGQTRYGSTIAPLLALFVLSGLQGVVAQSVRFRRTASVAMGSALLAATAASVPTYAELPRFPLPSGSTVLTGFSTATYSTVFENVGRVRVAPIFEISAAHAPVRALVRELAEGRLDCRAVVELGFSHVIENTLVGWAPSCLTLTGTQMGWRLWKVH